MPSMIGVSRTLTPGDEEVCFVARACTLGGYFGVARPHFYEIRTTAVFSLAFLDRRGMVFPRY